MFQVKVVEKIKLQILSSIIFFFENRVVYEIMWKNIVELDSPQMTIRRMRMARWITKATNTNSEYAIIFSRPQQHWLHERATVACLSLCIGSLIILTAKVCRCGTVGCLDTVASSIHPQR